MTRHGRLSILLAAVASLVSSQALAHDFWVACERWQAAPDTSVLLFLRTGHEGEVTPIAYRAEGVDRYFAIDATGQPIDIDPAVVAPAAGRVDRLGPGTTVVAYQSKPSFLALPGPRFEAYLNEEGLDSISRAREDAGTTARAGLERYSRHAKALVRVGTSDPRLDDREVGLLCELVIDEPAEDPASLAARLTLRGQPIGGARVKLTDLDSGLTLETRRTDRSGRVLFSRPASGRYLISSVHMEADTDDPTSRWRSYWASVTFELTGGVVRDDSTQSEHQPPR